MGNGYSYWSNPYSQSTSSYNYGMSGMYTPCSWDSYSYNPYYKEVASSIPTTPYTPEERDRLIQQALEEKQQLQQMQTQNTEAKKQIEEGKKADGSSNIKMSAKEYRKKTPWWKRALKAVGSMGQGIFNMAKGLVGFDKNGKWNPLKALKNAAIVVAGVALTVVCPAAGPVLLYAGLAAGALQVGKGVYNVCTAETVEDIDNAWQDVGAGVAAVACSGRGLKASAASASAVKVAAANGGTRATTFANVTNASKVSWLKNPGQVIKYNAQKGAYHYDPTQGKMVWDKTQLPKAESLKFWSRHSRKYENTVAEAKNYWGYQSRSLGSEIKTLRADGTYSYRTSILRNQQNHINDMNQMLSRNYTRANAQSYAKSISKDITKLEKIAISLEKGKTAHYGRIKIEPTPENLAWVNRTITQNKTLATELNEVIAAKDAMMAARARNPFKYGDEIKAWSGNQYGNLGSRLEAINPGGKQWWTATKEVGKGFFWVTAPEYMAWSKLPSVPSNLGYIAETTSGDNRCRDNELGSLVTGFLAPEFAYNMPPELVEEQLAQLNAQEEELKAAIDANQQQISALTA